MQSRRRPLDSPNGHRHLAQGMLLPLGAFNAHHNAPNTFLFHPLFGYTLGAGSDPLHVSGRAGGTRVEHGTRSCLPHCECARLL